MAQTDWTEQLAVAVLKETRAARRWRNVRCAVWVFLIVLILLLIFTPHHDNTPTAPKQPYVSIVKMNGLIMPGTPFSISKTTPELQRAFQDPHSLGVLLLINSPGGMPVQASVIHDTILHLKKIYKKKVVVLAEDTLASGGYLVATAADKIYVNKDTLTGSIGVIYSSFGVTGAMKKIGVTRRVITAGPLKSQLDPFEPLTPQSIAKTKRMLAAVHKNFINDVVKSRGKRLRGRPDVLFSGDFWTGEQAVKLGLVDGTANLWTILRKEFKATTIRDYTQEQPLWQTIIKEVGTTLHVHLQNNAGPIKTQAFES